MEFAEASERLRRLERPEDVGADVATFIETVDTPVHGMVEPAPTFAEVVRGAADAAPWVIPGLFRQDWRVVIVGGEGHGKSVLSRQIGLCASQGIHPFTFQPIPPIRVLAFDFENPAQNVAETGERLLRLAEQHSADYDEARMRYVLRLEGVDFRSRTDRAVVEAQIADHQPDLVIFGPAYLMIHKRSDAESDEDAARPVIHALNLLRSRYSCAVLIEHHGPHSDRMRPIGSSVWRRWSEIGRSMRPLDAPNFSRFALEKYRGDRMANEWPDEVHMGGYAVWPWEGRWKNGTPA